MTSFTTEDRISAELKKKAENYALSFFFSFVPENWSYEDLSNYLRQQEGDFNDMICELNLDEELAPWEPFEDMNPSWVADQMDMMVFQLCEVFK